MFIIKVLLGVLSIYFCSKIAISKANSLKNKYLFWESASNCCYLLLQEFSYKKRPIKSLLNYNINRKKFQGDLHQ